jgi:hypothetical protein
MAFTHTKKVYIGSFIKARIQIRSQTSGSGSDQKGPDPTGSVSGSATLTYTNFAGVKLRIQANQVNPFYTESVPAYCAVKSRSFLTNDLKNLKSVSVP